MERRVDLSKQELPMKTDQIEKSANRIADAIVELVERTDGPVTLAQVEREIPGFAKKDPPAWCKMFHGEHFVCSLAAAARAVARSSRR
jgi:hypothetical protein